jgi:hypothetical protein
MRKVIVAIVGLAVLWTLAATVRQVSAGVILPDLPAGSQYELAFVTSGSTTSTSSDIATYNAFVTQQASLSTSLPSGVTWRAIGSTPTTNAMDNAPTWDNIPIYNTIGEILADGRADFWGSGLQNPIGYDQSGNPISANYVWTGTHAGGTTSASQALGQWLPYSPVPGTFFSPLAGLVGDYQDPEGWLGYGLDGWTGFIASDTSLVQWPIYALSSPITVTPEPSTLTLLGAGAIGLAACAWRRKRPRA